MVAPTPSPSDSTFARELAAAFDWWREAGVDTDFADDATDWLAAAQEPAKADAPPPPPPAPPPPPRGPEVHAGVPAGRIFEDAGALPQDLAAFREWWLTAETIDSGGASPRIAPVGSAAPALMVVATMPGEGEREQPFGGPEGALLRGMLRAMGVAEDRAYFATLLPRHDPLPEWPAIAERGLGEVLSHHIGLVAPERILFLGRNIPPLLGHDMAQAPAILRGFNHGGRSIPALGAGGLADMLRSATRRERFWRSWLEWTYGDTPTD